MHEWTILSVDIFNEMALILFGPKYIVESSGACGRELWSHLHAKVMLVYIKPYPYYVILLLGT